MSSPANNRRSQTNRNPNYHHQHLVGSNGSIRALPAAPSATTIATSTGTTTRTSETTNNKSTASVSTSRKKKRNTLDNSLLLPSQQRTTSMTATTTTTTTATAPTTPTPTSTPFPTFSATARYKFGDLAAMPFISKSPYEPRSSAEVGEVLLDKLKLFFVSQEELTMGELHDLHGKPTMTVQPQARHVFGETLAESLVKAHYIIAKSGMMFSPQWLEEKLCKIRGVNCGWIPKPILLLLLQEQRFARASEANLSSLCNSMGLIKLFWDAMDEWQLDTDLYQQHLQQQQQQQYLDDDQANHHSCEIMGNRTGNFGPLVSSTSTSTSPRKGTKNNPTTATNGFSPPRFSTTTTSSSSSNSAAPGLLWSCPKLWSNSPALTFSTKKRECYKCIIFIVRVHRCCKLLLFHSSSNKHPQYPHPLQQKHRLLLGAGASSTTNTSTNTSTTNTDGEATNHKNHNSKKRGGGNHNNNITTTTTTNNNNNNVNNNANNPPLFILSTLKQQYPSLYSKIQQCLEILENNVKANPKRLKEILDAREIKRKRMVAKQRRRAVMEAVKEQERRAGSVSGSGSGVDSGHDSTIVNGNAKSGAGSTVSAIHSVPPTSFTLPTTTPNKSAVVPTPASTTTTMTSTGKSVGSTFTNNAKQNNQRNNNNNNNNKRGRTTLAILDDDDHDDHDVDGDDDHNTPGQDHTSTHDEHFSHAQNHRNTYNTQQPLSSNRISKHKNKRRRTSDSAIHEITNDIATFKPSANHLPLTAVNHNHNNHGNHNIMNHGPTSNRPAPQTSPSAASSDDDDFEEDEDDEQRQASLEIMLSMAEEQYKRLGQTILVLKRKIRQDRQALKEEIRREVMAEMDHSSSSSAR